MNDGWITQPYIYNWIQSQLKFQMILDLAADNNNKKCNAYIGKDEDALSLNWFLEHQLLHNINIDLRNINTGCFCNPPYSKPNLPAFTKKACIEAKNGLNQCFLVPLDITSWSRDYVWGQAEVWIPDERIAFIDPATGKPQTQPPKGSMIVIYGSLANKGLVKPVHIPKPGEL
jgi:phage N-6-adenine-methyltransferase